MIEQIDGLDAVLGSVVEKIQLGLMVYPHNEIQSPEAG